MMMRQIPSEYMSLMEADNPHHLRIKTMVMIILRALQGWLIRAMEIVVVPSPARCFPIINTTITLVTVMVITIIIIIIIILS